MSKNYKSFKQLYEYNNESFSYTPINSKEYSRAVQALVYESGMVRRKSDLSPETLSWLSKVDVDDFKEHVIDHMDANGVIVWLRSRGASYYLKDIFEQPFYVPSLVNVGSGYNNNEQFDKYGTWESAMYDIYYHLVD